MRKPVRRSSLGAEGLMIFRQREATAGRAAAGVPTAWLPGWVAYLAGVLGQAAGKYDSQTERLFEHAWRRQRSLRAMVGWLRFRRELGLAPEARQVKSLQTALDGKQGRLTTQTLELLLEAEALAPAVTGLSDKMLMAQANSSPPVAHLALARGLNLSARATRLAALQAGQISSRNDFAAQLGAVMGRVCVVGNAGSLNGAGVGAVIDDHDLVVRFNHWTTPHSVRADIGGRCDVWVCAPRFLAGRQWREPATARWIVLTGPDVRYARAGTPVDWDRVLELQGGGARILTVPLDIWGESVAWVGAPPSAGILFLVWAKRMMGGLQHLAVAGFDIASANANGYHHAGQHLRPGRRHNWDRERLLLDAWIAAGLGCVTGGTVSH